MRDVASEVHKQYLICQCVTKKCVVLDCDNVLWGGILSEDGIEGIQLGNSFNGLGVKHSTARAALAEMLQKITERNSTQRIPKANRRSKLASSTLVVTTLQITSLQIY